MDEDGGELGSSVIDIYLGINFGELDNTCCCFSSSDFCDLHDLFLAVSPVG